ncbi:MAG: GAF domain-containing sensor histidine kinase [Archangium sp.]|nr:GAF domain-containing sensor histidine kinase [Archangium sp.]
MSSQGEESGASESSAITQRAFLTSARLKLARLHLDGDLPRLFKQLCEISGVALEATRVGVWVFDDKAQLLKCEALWSKDGDAPIPLPLEMARIPTYVSAIKERRFVATSDARTDEMTRELEAYLEVWKVRALLDAAVYRNGEVYGIVCHEYVGEPREWKRDERQFAATVADLASHFIEVKERIAAQGRAYELELKLKDAHRLDALGRMAAGIAHDLNNMLAVITNGISILHRVKDEETLKTMEESAHHAAALVAQLMMLGRKKTPIAQIVELDPVLGEVDRISAAAAPAGVKLVLDVEKGLVVWAEASQLTMVLNNLISNAMQAMTKPGPVVLRAHARQEGVVFEVIDTGEGIKPENLEKLFDPFFTTRANGSGIGLAIVQQLVNQHGAEIKVSSTVGDGTTVRVWWPKTPTK